ncbi:hypothetical protein FE257_008221 [Aspergillus nanangensis]|uniref:Uncharacterized protein n=1 Tax=Aspergillus nanangensis TaxID=2582783 RepID=A0AAD4GTM5_ASPNN|nr:hypothetical protein FE257_008221 [Aspergillus nanangensis]
MAHDTNTLNWDILISNLQYRPLDHTSKPQASNIYLRLHPNQTADLYGFATLFASKIAVDTTAERQKYPAKYQPPSEDEYLLDDATALKISPMVQRIHHWRIGSHSTTKVRTCTHHDDEDTRFKQNDDSNGDGDDGDGFKFNCDCVLPLRERKVHAFLRQLSDNDCYMFDDINGAAAFNMRVSMALLLHGELDPILRICSHPGVGYRVWKTVQQCNCMPADEGWDQLYQLALRSYLMLNILRRFHELRVPPGGRRTAPYTETYRDTGLYQKIVHSCTNLEAEIPGLPHYFFFGVKNDTNQTIFTRAALRDLAKIDGPGAQWLLPPSFFSFLDSMTIRQQSDFLSKDEYPYGYVPFEIFCHEFSGTDIPSEAEREEAFRVLRSTVLPEELVLQVMDHAQVMDRVGSNGRMRQLPVPHDPLAEDNVAVLDQYLAECWRIMVQCSVFAHELGKDINWKSEVVYFLRHYIRGPDKELLDYVASELE